MGRRIPLLLSLGLLVFAAACDGDSEPTEPSGPADVAAVVLDADSYDVVIESTTTAEATPQDADGNALTNRTVSWSVANDAVATVDASGTLTGVSIGSTTVTARSEGVSTTATVQVKDVDLAERTLEADSVMTLQSDSEEVASGTLRYDGADAEVEVEVGDILIGATNEGGGYLKKVTSVSRNGSQITAQVQNATFAEAVEDANIEISVEETAQQMLARAAAEGNLDLPDGMSLRSDGTIALSRYAIDFGIDESGTVGGVTVSAEVDGEFAILTGSDLTPGVPSFLFKYKGGLNPRLFQAQAWVGAEFSVEASATVTGDLAAAGGWDVSEEILRRQIFPSGGGCAWKGPICYSVSMVVDAYIDVTAEASATVSQSAYVLAGINGAGVRWHRDEGFTVLGGPVWDYDLSSPTVEIEGAAGIRFGLRPNLEFEVYEGLADASAGIDGGWDNALEFNLWEWSAESRLVVDLFADANLSFWGLVDESAEYVIPELLTFTLWEGRGPLVELRLDPETVTLIEGETRQATATAYSLITGQPVGITPPLVWATAHPEIATVSEDGVLTGQHWGDTYYQAGIVGTDPIIASNTPNITVNTLNGPMKIGTCMTRNQQSCAFPGISPGESAWVFFGADPLEGNTPICGVTVDVYDPFTEATTTYGPVQTDNCLDVAPFTVPAGTPPGNYTFIVGPAVKDTWRDAEPVELVIQVNSSQ